MRNFPRRLCRFCLTVVVLLGQSALLSAQELPALTLQEAEGQVLAVHPLTQVAQARVKAALGLMRQARAYPNPSFAFANNNFALERTFGLTQSIEWPFRRGYRIGVARTDEQITEEEQESVRQDVVAIAREAFFTVLFAQESARVADAFVQATRHLQGSTEKLFAEGDIAEFDVMKTKVEALRAETDLGKAQGQLQTAQSGLNLLLGRAEQAPLVLAGSLLTARPLRPLAELWSAAEEQNPLLLVQRRTVEREQLNLKLARTALLPDVSIDVTHGEDRQTGRVAPLLGLSFSFPLWDRKEGATEAARQKVAEAEATLRATQLQVHQTLLTAYNNWQIARDQADAFTKGLVVQAEQAATLAEQSYHEGAGDLLGVLDAERSLLTVRRDYALALFAMHMAWVMVERAVGVRPEP
ncbi:MAG: TolC family protein [Deltaproteobacteria bacterium]|nr:TolC family protein [Deltaproteobacteria bacterium]